MDSPLFYELDFGENCMFKQKQQTSQLGFNLVEEPAHDFEDLNTPEASFDLNDLIGSSLTADDLFPSSNVYPRSAGKFNLKQEIAGNSVNSCVFHTQAPVANIQTPCDMKQYNGNMNWVRDEEMLMNLGSEIGFNVLNEDVKPLVNRAQAISSSPSGLSLNSLPTILPNVGVASPQSSDYSTASSSSSINRKKKNVDKSSDVYRIRRERNNIAVRKSREKAKQRSRDREEKVVHFQKQNDKLQECLNLLKREITLLESLFSQEPGLSQKVRKDIVDTFQRIKALSE